MWTLLQVGKGAMLPRGGKVEFGVLREGLDVSVTTLSKYLRTFNDVLYVDLSRVQRARGQARI